MTATAGRVLGIFHFRSRTVIELLKPRTSELREGFQPYSRQTHLSIHYDPTAFDTRRLALTVRVTY